jgi:hypothetical protein
LLVVEDVILTTDQQAKVDAAQGDSPGLAWLALLQKLPHECRVGGLSG